MRFTVTVTREENKWLAAINTDTGTGGATFARTLTALRQDVEALVSAIAEELDVESEIIYEARGLDNSLREAFALSQERARIEAEAAELQSRTKNLIAELSKQGYSARDTAGALGVSRGYVSKVAA